MAINKAKWANEYDRLSRKSSDAVYRELGAAALKLEGPRHKAYKLSPGGVKKTAAKKAAASRDLMDTGKAWFDKQYRELQKVICKNSKILMFFESGDHTKRDLFLVLVDVISSLNFAVPIGTIAMIIARRGLKEFCKL